ncbi:hypothetical protein GF389_05705 [Candidatus Dojkabacteria bacterium]|nr:hypothetical protein [Candidatus Dojkabacteria bacterium]
MGYVEFYKKGIKHFQEDLNKLESLIKKGQNVCLASAPFMGDNRLIDYYFHIHKEDKNTDIHYQKTPISNFDRLLEDIQKYKNKRTVLLFPRLGFSDPQQIKKLENFLMMDKDGKYCAISHLDCEVHDNPEYYFKNNGFLLSNVVIRQPYDLQKVRSDIQLRREMNGWVIDPDFEEKIYVLSGGIVGLIKRICEIIDMQGEYDMEILVKDLGMKVFLERLAEVYAVLDIEELKKIGLVNEEGNLKSILLKEYVDQTNPEQNMPEKLKVVYQLLLHNKGKLVTIDEIDFSIRGKDDFSYWGNYKIISRLKKAIKDKYLIKNIKGKGYILDENNGGKLL